MKKIIIIAGPNGAGKTTFAEEFLLHEAGCPEFVNADLIAAGLSPFQPDQAAFAAGRLMRGRIATLVAAGRSFAFETTLATHGYRHLIPKWQADGYSVKLHFLRLPDADFAIRRVEQRVRMGGHHIPDDTVRRRFARGWANLREHYLGLVNEWAIYDSSRIPHILLATGGQDVPDTLMEDSTRYETGGEPPAPPPSPANADLIGAEAAMKRAAANAVRRARAAGLEPVAVMEKEEPE